MAIVLKANKVNLFVSSVLIVFWYHSPKVLGTPHICNISWLRVKFVRRLTVVGGWVPYCVAQVSVFLFGGGGFTMHGTMNLKSD
jgi:hypothetical protein